MACKICGGATRPFGAVDFNKSCEEARGLRLAPAGVEVPYERCGDCGLLFTRFFDDWSQKDFEARIYNEAYAEVDPDFEEVRPSANAGFVIGRLGAFAKTLKVLDYGGGNGRFAERLAEAGFTAQTYDPFSPAFAERPRQRFNLVTCFETLEHMPDPKAGAASIAGLLHRGGLLIFSTLLQPPEIETLGLSWWYAGPRNGHVTLHTARSLAALWRPFGLQVVSFDQNMHAAFQRPPGFAAGLLASTRR